MEVLESVGALTSFALGVIGIVTDTRNRATGRLTRWGKLTLAGFGIATIVTAVQHAQSEIDDRARQYLQASEATSAIIRESVQLRKLNQTFEEVRRAGEPIPKAFTVSIDINAACAQLQGGLSESLCSPNVDTTSLAALSPSLREQFARLLSLDDDGGLDISFFPADRIANGDRVTEAVLQLSVNLRPPSLKALGDYYTLFYSKENRRVEVMSWRNDTTGHVCCASPQVHSILDLPGKAALLKFNGTCGGTFRADLDGYPCVPDSVTLQAPGGQLLHIKNFRPLKSVEGFVGIVTN